MMRLEKCSLQNPKQWAARMTAILVLALLGLGIINRGNDFDVPHTEHNTYEPEPTLAVSDYASGSSTATISTYPSTIMRGLTPAV